MKKILALIVLIIIGIIGTLIIINKGDNIKIKNQKSIQNLYSNTHSGAHVIIDKKGNAYLEIVDYSDDYQTKREQKEEIKKQYKEYIIKDYHEDVDGCDSKVKKNDFKGIKLPVKNVIAAYEIDNGQEEGSNAVLLIKEDGTVSGFNVYNFISTGYLKFYNNIDNLKNIVSIVQSASCYYACGSGSTINYAIDKDGNYYDIKETFID